MTTSIRVGMAMLPESDPAQDDRWARAEQYGFAHAWTFDHLAWRTLADSPWHATVPTLSVAAMTTSRIPLGLFVASPNFRHPVPFAKELMTLDILSGGRLRIGVGAGGPGPDARMLGQIELTPRQRADRFEEFVTLLDLLLRQPVTTWRGEYFAAVEARTIPGPVQSPRPPIVVAGNGPRGMRMALTQGEGWATMGVAPHGAEPETWWRGVEEAVDRFAQIASAVGVDPHAVPWYLDVLAMAGSASSLTRYLDDVGRARDLGFSDIVLAWPRADPPFAGSERVLEQLASVLDADGSVSP